MVVTLTRLLEEHSWKSAWCVVSDGDVRLPLSLLVLLPLNLSVSLTQHQSGAHGVRRAQALGPPPDTWQVPLQELPPLPHFLLIAAFWDRSTINPF
jgi:hypothetical protein